MDKSLLIICMYLCYYLDGETMKKIMQNKYLIIGVILYIFNILLLIGVTDFKLNFKFFISLFVETLLIILLYFFVYKKSWNIEKKFIISFFIIGLFYLFLFPIGSLPDEINHFMRGYEISNGNLISSKCKSNNGCTKITKEIENAILSSGGTYSKNKISLLQKYNDKSPKYNYILTNISMYSFVCYIPQAIGIFLGRMLNLPILLWAYLARLFNFFAFVFLLNFSIKKIPYKKTIIMFIALLPITYQEVVSMAADCMAIGSSLAFISYVLFLKENSIKIEKKQVTILFILSLMLSMSKLVYLPLCIFSLLIPCENFKNKKQKYCILGIILFIVSILNLFWLHIASDFLLSITGGVDPDLQLDYIISNPLRYIKIIIDSVVIYFDLYLYSMLGSSLGLFKILPSPIYIKMNVVILILLILFENSEKISKKIRILSAFIFITIIILIFTSLYLDWTIVGNQLVDGVQGRYFIPILMPFILLLSSTNFKIKDTTIFNKNVLLLIMFMENIYILSLIFNNY